MIDLEEKHQAFGLLKGRTDLEGLAFQEKLRLECDKTLRTLSLQLSYHFF